MKSNIETKSEKPKDKISEIAFLSPKDSAKALEGMLHAKVDGVAALLQDNVQGQNKEKAEAMQKAIFARFKLSRSMIA